MHIAIYQGRDDIVALLSPISHLQARRNQFGLSPIEMANYLDRTAAAKILSERHPVSFFEQSNVIFEESGRIAELGGLDYLPNPVYATVETFRLLLSRTRKAKVADAIPAEKIWMGIYFDKEMQTGMHPKVSLQWLDHEIGFGLFAAQRIPSCSFVGEYTGVVSERRAAHVRGNNYCVRCTSWETGRKSFTIDATKRGNFTRFINHSAKPNLGLQSIYWRGLPRMIFISLQEIAEGEQLMFDYGTSFWKDLNQVPKVLV